jgi:hypothetical protein
MMILLVNWEGIKLKSTFLDDVFSVLTDDVDHATAGGVSEGDGQGESKEDIDHFFTVDTEEQSGYLFFFSGFFAGFTGIIRLFPGDLHDPATRIRVKTYSREE